MARKPGKRQKDNPVGCTGEAKRLKRNIGKGLRESKTGTVLEARTLAMDGHPEHSH